jgi:2'-5' RNA ligase
MGKGNGNHKRLFVALQTSPEHCDSLDAVREQMPLTRAWKRTHRQDDHISLAFLGAVSNGRYDELYRALRDFAQDTDPIPLRFTGVYSFLKVPGNGKPHPEDAWSVLAAFPDPAAYSALQDLHRRLAYEVLDPNGYEFGRTTNMPHNTLARVNTLDVEGAKITEFIRAHGTLTTPEVTYTHLALYDHNKDRALPYKDAAEITKYDVIETFPFRGANLHRTSYRRPKGGRASTPEADSI